MSGQLKEVRTRIKSVISTQQITKAMKMVSAAKLRRAQDNITRLRPYAEKLKDILANILGSVEGEFSLELAETRPVERVLIILYSSDRGLCGGFNANLYKRALSLVKEKYAHLPNHDITVMTIGKKGFASMRKQSFTIDNQYLDAYEKGAFEQTVEIAEYAVKAFREKRYDAVEIVYSQFKNAATQIFQAETFLPLAKVAQEEKTGAKTDFIFEPDRAAIIEQLIPRILNTQLYKSYLDTIASEHGARMTAMDKATENASELLKDLRISYNRARQAAITTELSEIVAGAAALEGA